MGYMGFGMNKENYTRRPNEAFKKIKEYSKKEIKKKKWKNPNLRISLKNFGKRKFKHFYQTLVFSVIKILVSLTVVGLLIWAIFLQDIYFEYQKTQFEKHGIIEYFHKSEKDIIEIKSFFNQRKFSILLVESLYYWGSEYQIITRSHHIDSIRYNMKYPPSFYRHKKDEIKDRMESDNLVIERKENKASIIEKDWIYSFSNENINDLSPTFFLYMNTSPQEFMDILRILHKNKWDIYQFDDFTITFDHADFDDYDFVFTDNSLKTDTSDSQIRRIGIIDEGIYWRKKEEIKTEE